MVNDPNMYCVGWLVFVLIAFLGYQLHVKLALRTARKREKWLANRGWFITHCLEGGKIITRATKENRTFSSPSWAVDPYLEPINQAYACECAFGNPNPVIDRLCNEHDRLTRRLDRLGKEEAQRLATNNISASVYDREFPFIYKRIEEIEGLIQSLTKFKDR